jgi:hypothetical protein
MCVLGCCEEVVTQQHAWLFCGVVLMLCFDDACCAVAASCVVPACS